MHGGVEGAGRVKARRPNSHDSITARLHRWLGFSLGAVLVICGLTGSYLAFYMEIERAVIPELRISAGAQPSSYEDVYQALTKVGSPEKGAWNIELPEDGGVITSRYSGGGNGQNMVSLDPVTLEVVRDVTWGSTVSTWVYELHYRLLMGRSGAVVMGLIGIGLLVMLVAGTILWWRSGRTARSRLKFDLKGNGQRKLFDTHRLLGLGSLLLLLITIGTATAMSLPKQVRPVLELFSPIVRSPDPESGAAQGRARIPVDQAIAIAATRIPQGEVRWVRVPNKPEGVYAVRFWQPGEPSNRFPKSYVWVDQYDGQVLAIRNGPQDTASDRILTWFYPLHSGEAFGLLGRSVVALLGLVPAILFITGLLRWRSKNARLKAHRRRTASQS